MEQQGSTPGTDSGPNMVWIIVKIAIVILIVLVGIKFFSERKSGEEENGYVERKKTKPTKTRKKKKDD